MDDIYNPYYYPVNTPTNNGLDYNGASTATDAVRSRMNVNGGLTSRSSSKSGGGVSAGQIGSAALTGLNAYGQAKAAGGDDFSLNTMAGHMGGLGGAGGGWIGMAAGAIGGYMGDNQRVLDNLKAVNTNINATDFDASGNPVYQGGTINQAINTENAINSGVKSDSDRVAQLFYAGGSNVFDVLYGTNKKLKKKRAELQRNIAAAQSSFNQTSTENANRIQSRKAYDEVQRRLFSNDMGLPSAYNIY